MIGDSLHYDIHGAVNFEIDSCWYNPNHLENKTPFISTYEINELEEILSIIN